MLPLLPTTLVGSYAQPDWLIDRENLGKRFPPRVRAKELWRVAPSGSNRRKTTLRSSPSATRSRAGLDIITDGEMRCESYSNRFATGLDGVDIDNPGTALDRSGHPNPVPRVVGPIKRRHPVQVRDVKFLRANTDRSIKITVPGPFTMSQQAQDDYYKDEVALALDYAAAVDAEIKDLFAAGADIVQVDKPYMQARAEKAKVFGVKVLDRALDGVTGTTAVHICFGYAAVIHNRPPAYSFLPEYGELKSPANLDRDGAGKPRLRCALETAEQDHPPRRAGPLRYEYRASGDRRRPHPSRPAACAGRSHRRRARLRSQVSAARRGARKNAGYGRRRSHCPEGVVSIRREGFQFAASWRRLAYFRRLTSRLLSRSAASRSTSSRAAPRR